MFATIKVYADPPYSPYVGQGSNYHSKQDTITVSSKTVTTIAAAGSSYQTITLQSLSNNHTTIYYRIDGSTVNVPTVGLGSDPTTMFTIETNSVVYLQLAATKAAVTLRRLINRR